MEKVNSFLKSESGAVTVDWVVLTAAIVGIAIAVIGLISSGVNSASSGINDELSDVGSLVASLFGGESTVYGAESGFQEYGFRYDEAYNEGLVSGDVELASSYQTAYEAALAEPDAWNLDELAGFEKAMVEKGLDIPEGNLSATAIQEQEDVLPLS